MKPRVYANWPISRYTLDVFKARFWERVDIGGPDECWIWNGTCHDKKKPYGRVNFMFKRQKAHRVAYWITYGHLPDDLMVCHSCNTHSCVNPKHLYLGTNLDNQRDSWKRGVRQGPMLGRKGDRSPNHKLTEAQTKQIRLLKEKGKSQTKIAKEFSVTQGAISRLLSGETWKV